jgi:hypothetical protein
MANGAGTNGSAVLYAKLEERVLERDQRGATDVYHALLKAGRSLTEISREIVRVHAPYTHVPYHQRVDRGFLRFVNNDHCLSSTRVGLRMSKLLPADLHGLGTAQTIWYVPTGLDPWNQLIGKMPGHYGRRTYQKVEGAPVPRPQVHWEDQKPQHLDMPYADGLDHWLTLVQRGEVIEAYRVFLGLFEQRERRRELLAQLAFAGLIDVQDRVLNNRSYTTGHKSFRARSTFELGEAIGWDDAHDVLYAGALDMAVGPRWHSAYEMACQMSWTELADDAHRNQSSMEASPSVICEERLWANRAPLTAAEARELFDAMGEREPAPIDTVTRLLLAGKDPKAMIDVMQLAAADRVLTTADGKNFSIPQHCYQYMNTLRWFFDTFEHPHRLKLLYVAANYLSQAQHWLDSTPGNGKYDARVPAEAASLSAADVLARLDAAQIAMQPEESVAWTRAYLQGGWDRQPLVQTLLLDSVKHGNDTHNQEIALCLLEDYLRNPQGREALLLACAQHTAGHQKYGDTLEPYRRYLAAFGLS